VNTATSLEALRDNTEGEDNTANGYRALIKGIESSTLVLADRKDADWRVAVPA
jgi:hypothetical protein